MKPAHRSAPEREPNTPWSLTASDGTGLDLRSVDARAVVEGPLAFTELHLTFHNPEDRIREGTFSITLPARAAVSRFAMFEDNHFKEAEVVATALARRAYDDAIHANIDPAILEKGAGNQFTARVFPIPASGDKELVISYSQELAGAGYLLPLKGLPTIADVRVSLQNIDANAGRHETTLLEKQWQPDHDFWVDVETSAGLASNDLIAAAFEVQPTHDATADVPSALTLLVDTSASRAPGFRRYIERTRTFVTGLAARYPGLTLDVIAFDQETTSIYSGPAATFGDEQIEAFIERRADGASDLELAAAAVKRASRVAIITDGVVTAGLEATPLFDAWRKAMPARVDVMLAGGVRDDKVAKRLVRSGQRAGDVFDFDDELGPIEAGLGESVRIDVPVEVANATWFYPHTIPSARAGTQIMVYARMAEAPTSLMASIGGVQSSTVLWQGTPALVERAAAGAEIAELETKLDAATADTVKQELKKQIETISIAARVVSSQATMLILDNDRQYEKYGIDRNALHDILVVGKNGLEQSHRTFVASKDRKAGRSSDFGRSGFGEGGSTGWGTIGTGRYSTIGYGSGHGSLQGRTASVPTVSIAAPMVTGDLDKNIIRRYIRRNLEKITYCYEKELLARPHIAGALATHFTIEPDGHVSGVEVSGFDDAVATCVNAVMANIAFPPTPGERVVINYPFTFRSPNSPPEPTDEIAAAIAAPAIPATSPTLASPETPAAPPTSPVVVGAAPETPMRVSPTPAPVSAPTPAPAPTRDSPAAVADQSSAPTPASIDPMPRFDPATAALRGKLAQVMRKIAKRDPDVLAFARQWRDEQPTDVLAIIGLGEVAESRGDIAGAARSYGSLIDLYPSRADYRRFAGERLLRLGKPARWLAIDTFRRAETDRPDQITGHRLLAYALLRDGDYAGALDAILRGIDTKVPDDRYAGAAKLFHRDAGMIAAAYIAHGGDRAAITQRLAKHQIELVTDHSLRAILYWETDANDVDLHIHDAHGGHSWYQHLPLESGGALYADITTGYGPECFEVTGAANAGPYQIGVHYYRQGPMGYGMGLVEIVRFDGNDFAFDDRPYMIMQDEAYVSLGRTP
jgi:Vault protein inter-alpha-trypsin domain